jgi:hypothetical protein
MTDGRRARTTAASGRLLLVVALVVAVWSSGLGLSRPTAYHGMGDAPRYLMNGVFLLDLLQSGTPQRPSALLQFAERYYAQYPALSLGHHPPLFPASLVPFFLVMGVSALAARLAMVVWFVGAVWLLHGLGRRLYDERVAGWAALLFASCPAVFLFAGQILAEVPAIAMVLAAVLLLERFRGSGRVSAYLLFCAAVIASLLTRPTAIYMFPAYAVLLLRDGWLGRLTSGGIAVVNGLALGLGAVLVLGYMTLSPFNSSVVLEVIGRGVSGAAVSAVAMAVIDQRELAFAMAAGLAGAALTRDKRVLVPLAWVLSVLACALVLTGAIEAGRYTIISVPAMCLIGASVVATARTRMQQAVAATGLASLVVLQVADTARRPARDLPGYEEAARYVVGVADEPTILYSASADTGYFVFFVRQHDQDRRLAVLRSDKLLTTSRMGRLNVESRIAGPDEIPGILQRYGTRFVTIEDQPTGDRTLEWLRALVRTDRFVERRRFPAGPGVDGVDLVVYEYLDATLAARDAELDLNLPLVGRRISVRLADIGRPSPR